MSLQVTRDNPPHFGSIILTHLYDIGEIEEMASKQKTVVVGAGPVGALAAIYAAQRGHEVEVYEVRNGQSISLMSPP